MTQFSEQKPAAMPPAQAAASAADLRNKASIGLLGAAAVFAIIVIVMVAWVGWGVDVPVRLWLLALSALSAAVGLWVRMGSAGQGVGTLDSLRVQGMVLGGLAGFATAALGLALALFTYRGVFAGGLDVWRDNRGRVLLCALALFGGLGLMFASLQLGRTVERANAAVRRLVYGYNAFLMGLLLLAILVLINVLAYVPFAPFSVFGNQWDWTASGIYTLKPATTNFLKELDRPVKVYMLLPRADPIEEETVILLNNFKSVTNKVSWQSLSRDMNRKDINELADKYQLSESLGLLVVYGTDPEQNEFIRREDLFVNRTTEERMRFTFKGEAVLMKALTLLAEDKKRAVVYFTQGNGEPTLAGGAPGGRRARTLGELRDRLTRSNYEVKELKLAPGVDKVPDDAAVVVVAGPRTPLPDSGVKALTQYMSQPGGKGKLVLLLDVAPGNPASKMEESGLEGLMAQFGVKAGTDRILGLTNLGPTSILASMNEENRSPLAQAFVEGWFLFDDARVVEASGGAPRGGARVETLMHTLSRVPVWTEGLGSNPTALLDRLETDPDAFKALQPKLKSRLPVAVTVVEGTGDLPNIPGHAGVVGKDDKPRMVVFGDASWITDEMMQTRLGRRNVDLFTSTLAWLRGRANIGADAEEGTDRKQFTLAGEITPEKVSRLRWLPVWLMLVAIVGLGGGIWLARRR